MGEKYVRDGRDSQFFLRRVWEVLFPYLIYYLVFNAVYIIVAYIYQVSMEYFGEGYRQFMTVYADTVSGVAGGFCTIIAMLSLMPMLKKELLLRREATGGTDSRMRTGKCVLTGLFTVIFAACASVGLNALFTMAGFVESSRAYQQVADRQYGVTFGIGLVLYGLVSPFAEEVLFRGVIYNRLRRSFGMMIGIVASALFFGVFHGNLVQGVYGTIMGIIIAYVYERQGSFFWSVVFHAAANMSVYTVAHLQEVQSALFTPWGCVILLAVAVVCVFLEEKGKKR